MDAMLIGQLAFGPVMLVAATASICALAQLPVELVQALQAKRARDEAERHRAARDALVRGGR